jgi:hypothetical protein
MRSRVRRWLRTLGALVDSRPRLRSAVSGGFARFYARRGADPVLLAEARATERQTPIAMTRATMRWAASLSGGASVPSRFRPERRIQSPVARELALERLDQALEVENDQELRRHRALLRAAGDPDDRDLAVHVQATLDRRLRAFATRTTSDLVVTPAAGHRVLCLLDDLLREAGHRPFLVSGTLLGVVRQGGLLEHDYDLDLGLLPGDGDVEAVGRTLAAHRDLTVTVDEERVWGTHVNGVAFDVFLHYEEAGRVFHATRAHAWWNTPFDLSPRALGNREFWCPDDVDTYLRENYGNWQQPVAWYHKSFDTPNRVFRDTPEALDYLFELAMNATGSKPDRFTAESAVRELATRFGIDLRHHFAASRILDDDGDITSRS